MSKELLQAVLNKDFYLEHKDLIDKDIFDSRAKDIYSTIEWAYKEGANNLTIEELKGLYLQRFPVETETGKSLAFTILNNIKELEPLQPRVAKLILKQARINRLEDDLAQIFLERNVNLDKVRELLFEIERLKGDEKITDVVDLDIVSLLERTSKNCRWKFNIPALYDMVGGIGDGIFSLIAGRVNSGKSLAALSLCFSPLGFAEQGAKILYLCNEEDGAFAGIRAVSSFTGLTLAEINANKEQAAKVFSKIRPNSIILDNARITMSGLTKMVEKYKPDIVVADMLDHIQVSGDFGRDDLRLGQVYRQAREIAKIYRCAFIGVSQTSAESDGKLHYGFDALANSKTEKPAACDLILLLGQEAPDSNGNYSMHRAINVAKNKITGKHGAITCMIQPEKSRLVI